MIKFEVDQNTPEWFSLRCGIPTASNFDKILTPTGKLSAQSESYACLLLAELVQGQPLDKFPQSYWMERGAALEDEAANAYSMLRDVELELGGFGMDDTLAYGASPDRIASDKGTVEIKVPAPWTHVEYAMWGDIPSKYKCQVQGQMLVYGAEYSEWVSYQPDMPAVIIHAEKDEKFCSLLHESILEFDANMDKKIIMLKDRGFLSHDFDKRKKFEKFKRAL